jgi:hypothetical protein
MLGIQLGIFLTNQTARFEPAHDVYIREVAQRKTQ